ncbi:hypothetical protein BC827DRAFT_1165655 [Russula dissimulans]|nr:hypothetical protein BC827DRAFT_1165655 [Russula dissimulans]
MSPTIKVVKKTATPSSEIDDIFTRKAETVTVQASGSNLKQKRRKKKRPETPPAEPNAPTPEIVLDPSTQRLHASTSKTVSHDRLEQPKKRRKVVETKSDEDKFKDSRGTGPRRKTDEGFTIYKENELGIDPEAGGQLSITLREFIHIPSGTPLCPFDCNCCF